MGNDNGGITNYLGQFRNRYWKESNFEVKSTTTEKKIDVPESAERPTVQLDMKDGEENEDELALRTTSTTPEPRFVYKSINALYSPFYYSAL